jgi:hypothetical protein
MHNACCEKAEVGRSAWDIHFPAQPKRLAVIRGLGKRQFFQVLVYQVGNPVEYPKPFFRRSHAPGRKGLLGGQDCNIYIFLIAIRDLPGKRAGSRVNIIDKIPAQRPDKVSTDIVFEVIWWAEFDIFGIGN